MATPVMQSGKPNMVVVAHLNGPRLRGYVYNFSAVRESFILFPGEHSPQADGSEVDVRELKAVFFVRTFEGNRERVDANELEAAGHGRRIEVTFRDGEKMVGTTEAYNPHKPGFFLFPADAESNNTRVFVINRNVQQVRFL